MNYLKSFIFIICISLQGQEIHGFYELDGYQYSISFDETGQFTRVYSLEQCASGIHDIGSYKIYKDTLELKYSIIDYESPTLVEKKINRTIVKDSLQTISVKVIDLFNDQGPDFIAIRINKEWHNSFPENNITINQPPNNTELTIGIGSLKSFETINLHGQFNYNITLVIDSESIEIETYKVLEKTENSFSLRNIKHERTLNFSKL